MSIFLWVFFLNQILFFHINLNILKKTLYIYIYTHYGFYFQRLRFVLSLVPFFLFFWQRYARGARFSLVVAPQRVPPFTRDLYPIFFLFWSLFYLCPNLFGQDMWKELICPSRELTYKIFCANKKLSRYFFVIIILCPPLWKRWK
jgi:hypothetical protein